MKYNLEIRGSEKWKEQWQSSLLLCNLHRDSPNLLGLWEPDDEISNQLYTSVQNCGHNKNLQECVAPLKFSIHHNVPN